jgi:3-oxoacyl-[acyl-carrier protein] reductase
LRSRFTDKVAIITGASTGLGPVMARMMASEGAKVVIAARRFELLKETAAEIGDAAIPIQADVTREEDVAAMVDAAMSKWGQVDIMMNNAAQPGTDKYLWEQTVENWNDTIAIDVTAAMLCTREVLRRSMLERRTGAIVNFSSGAVLTGEPRKSHYVVAKVGLHALTKVTAVEAGPYNIRCNCVIVGPLDTELLRNFLRRRAGEEGTTYEEKRAVFAAPFALQRFCAPEEIAEAAMFLASDEASVITGQSISVDSGRFMLG